MTESIGTEPVFIRSVLDGMSDPRATLLRYGMLSDDVSHLIAQNLNGSAMQLLSGLLRARRIVGLSDAEISCAPSGTLTSVDERYLNLSICCGRTFVSSQAISAADIETLQQNECVYYSTNTINYDDILYNRTNSCVKTWSLTEGGALRPSDVLLPHLSSAAKVVVYDRFFDIHALDATESAISAAAHGGTFDAHLLILIGGGQGGVTPAQIKSRLEPRMTSALNLQVTNCTRPPGSNQFLHDRYIQIDQAYTFVFPAGLSCFTVSNGKNRASSIALHDLYIHHAIAELVRQDDGCVVRLAY